MCVKLSGLLGSTLCCTVKWRKGRWQTKADLHIADTMLPAVALYLYQVQQDIMSLFPLTGYGP